MKAAVIFETGKPPVYGEFNEPDPAHGEVCVNVTASAQRCTAPIRFVQIGTASDPNITLPGVLLRSCDMQIMGSRIGNVTLAGIMQMMSKLMEAARVAGFKIATKPLPLHRIAEGWSIEGGTPRIVFTMSSSFHKTGFSDEARPT